MTEWLPKLPAINTAFAVRSPARLARFKRHGESDDLHAMLEPVNDEDRSRNALEPINNLLTLAAGSAALVGAKTVLLTTAPTLVVPAISLGFFGARISAHRARKAVQAAARNANTSLPLLLLELRWGHPNRDEVVRAVRDLLRGIEDALDAAVIDPLMRVAQLLNAREISPSYASRLARALRQFRSEELRELKALLDEALAKTAADPLRLAAGFQCNVDDASWTRVFAGDGTAPLNRCRTAGTAFRVLMEAGIAYGASRVEDGRQIVTAGGDNFEGNDARLRMDIEIAQDAAELLRDILAA